jgi:hypothetical protein
MGGGHTHRRDGDLISIFFFFPFRKESRLESALIIPCAMSGICGEKCNDVMHIRDILLDIPFKKG